jgi:ferredoxin
LLEMISKGRRCILYSRPNPEDRQGIDFDETGHITVDVLEKLGVAREADFYLCGPPPFMKTIRDGLAAWGVANDRVHSEVFGPGESMTPGVAERSHSTPHPPAGPAGTGPRISFARSALNVFWDAKFSSLLEFAEACDVPVRWSCRTGVCHTCESGLISGRVVYQPEPLQAPAQGNLLICCAQPGEDVILDL